MNLVLKAVFVLGVIALVVAIGIPMAMAFTAPIAPWRLGWWCW